MDKTVVTYTITGSLEIENRSPLDDLAQAGGWFEELLDKHRELGEVLETSYSFRSLTQEEPVP